jgi:hypothetical protein
MEQRNVVSVSWGDHLTFGEGDGRLATLDAVRRRMERWRDDLNATILHWRLNRAHVKGQAGTFLKLFHNLPIATD